MISIAICDDQPQELANAQALLMKYACQHAQYEVKIFTFLAPLELLAYVAENGSFDVLLLDVYMAGMLGTETARELRQLGDTVEIIFLTTSRDHCLDAFEVDAAQYLVKPYTEEGLFAALNKVMKRINIDGKQVITLKTSEGITRLEPRNIIFTETSKNNYQRIHTIQGKTIEARITSTELFYLLGQNKYFIRCGASMNLNLKYVRQISKEKITLDTGEQLAFPYRFYTMLKERFLCYQMENED